MKHSVCSWTDWHMHEIYHSLIPSVSVFFFFLKKKGFEHIWWTRFRFRSYSYKSIIWNFTWFSLSQVISRFHLPSSHLDVNYFNFRHNFLIHLKPCGEFFFFFFFSTRSRSSSKNQAWDKLNWYESQFLSCYCGCFNFISIIISFFYFSWGSLLQVYKSPIN